MRRAVPAVAAACLLAGPTVLAFCSGGYYAEPRLIAAIVAWLLVLALALLGPAPLPRGLPGRLAAGGLALIAAWSAVSIAWAPLHGPAVAAVERLVLYLGVLLLAIAVFRGGRALRAVEPALAAGATAVIGYGLSGRLLPGLIHLDRSRAAGGRLEQPITYWNAEGALAAVGLVLCARLAGDRTRPVAVRSAAAAAVVPLAAGVYLSFSRGAVAAAVLGLVVLAAVAPSAAQLRAVGAAAFTGMAAAVLSAVSPAVSALEGTDAERAGAIVLGALLVLATAAALLTRRLAGLPDGTPSWARRLRPLAYVAAALVALGLVAGALGERPTAAELSAGAQAKRLTTVSSNRYEYWRVALRGFEQHPLGGLGAGGFRVFWLRERSITETVKDTHSLELEMAAELGLVGLLAFGAMLTGVVLAARTALRRHPGLAAGPVAAVVVWLVHASIDWDWQLPAVTLPAIVLAGVLVALAERVSAPAPDPAAAAPPERAAPSPGRAAA
jgi:O-antigen ligase